MSDLYYVMYSNALRKNCDVYDRQSKDTLTILDTKDLHSCLNIWN